MSFLGLDFETSARYANIALICLGALGALIGAFAYKWSDKAQSMKDAERDRIQSELQLATAGADARAAEANAKAAEASKGTATALLDAAAANERTAKLEREAEQQRERAANAEEKAARAEATAASLERRIEPRSIGRISGEKLIEALRRAGAKGAVDITCVMGDAEGAAFAEQLDKLLKAGGWQTSGVSHAAYTGGNPIGWGIMVNSVAAIPPHAASLREAFGAAGFPIGIIAKPSEIAAGAVRMIVGVKQ